MNYLAHIHQAHITNTSLLGNFLGDFVKGSDLSHLPDEIVRGIRLHRKIDTFTDNHSVIVELRQTFPKALRRMSGVVVDIYFDHLLCKHWRVFTQYKLEYLLHQFYEQLQAHELNIDGRYPLVKAGLLEYKWLQDYEKIGSCYRAFYQIEKRLRHRVKFAALAEIYIANNKLILEQAFLSFYPNLTEYSLQQNT